MAHFVITCAYLKGIDLTGWDASRPNQPLFAQRIFWFYLLRPKSNVRMTDAAAYPALKTGQ
jgi:hypothetical protein